MNDRRLDIGYNYSKIEKSLWGSYYILFIPFYFFAVLFFIPLGGSVISKFFGFYPPTTVETLLFDLVVFLGAPIGLLIWLHIRITNTRIIKNRKIFLETHDISKLRMPGNDGNWVLEVRASSPEGDLDEMRLVWENDKPALTDSWKKYDITKLREFDLEKFNERP